MPDLLKGRAYPEIVVTSATCATTFSISGMGKGLFATTASARYTKPTELHFVLCKGEDCNVDDFFSRDRVLGIDELDDEFRVKTKQPALLAAVLDDETLIETLRSYRNIRVQGDSTHLRIMDYSIVLDIPALVGMSSIALRLSDRISAIDQGAV